MSAYFNDKQRQATKDASSVSDVNILIIINGSTAIVFAYELDKKDKAECIDLELGEGTFGISLLTIDERMFDTKATARNTHLGGEDFNNKLVEYYGADFQNKKDVDIRKYSMVIRGSEPNIRKPTGPSSALLR
jgi:molecular chaperone DnaK (HSP70)